MNAKNTLFIIADEHTRRYSGCYGDPVVKTPFLDKIAAEGVTFTKAYTPSPTCVAARACLATGEWLHQNEYFSSVEAYDMTRPSWGHHLIDKGHEVVSVGKLGYLRAGPGNGFTREFLPIHNLNELGWVRGLLRNPLSFPEPNVEVVEFANHVGVGETDYTKYDRVVSETACAWLRQAAQREHDKPWTLFVSLTSPHYPLICPQEFWDLYDDDEVGTAHRGPDIEIHPLMQELRKFYNYDDHFDADLARKARRAYFGLCSFTDYLVGNLLTTLELAGLKDDTRVIYTSDHGEMLGSHGLWTKFQMYEDSVAIPMLMSGPDIPQGVTCDTPVSLIDLYPTLIEAAGEPLNEREENLDGVSLFRIIEGEKPERFVLSEYHDGGVSTGIFMLLNGPWKYIYYPGFRPQLFNHETDPNEDVDLAEDPNFANALAECENALRSMLDPEKVNARALEKQAAIIEKLGGYDAINNMEQSDIFIEVEALYVNNAELRTPCDLLVASEAIVPE
ncbi:sulfatase-like hydrolase/transferase [Shimia sediminis]|uniref:sulfatase-like hydrolase/transferase n=1 Tax=Shimia sediminis TaxID=2497945 RepID=UPI000F8EB149|nr:sulfatase-like hydrolase/transferase [Shimia sediminis]